MEHTNHYPNLTDAEKQWLLKTAALRPEANVEDLMNSFLTLFPDRTQHDGLTTTEIRQKLTSRFNDILYRTDRGYAPCIAEKRNDIQQAFAGVFAVLNPLAQMNFFEQMFTDPKAKPSDKFKAIQEAETLNKRVKAAAEKQADHQRKIQEEQELLERMFRETRDELYWRVSEIAFQSFLATLPEPLQEQINAEAAKNKEITMTEIAEAILQKQGMHAEVEKIRDIDRDDRYKRRISKLSPVAVMQLLRDLEMDAIKDNIKIASVDGFMDFYDKEYPTHDNLTPMQSHLRNLQRVLLSDANRSLNPLNLPRP